MQVTLAGSASEDSADEIMSEGEHYNGNYSEGTDESEEEAIKPKKKAKLNGNLKDNEALALRLLEGSL